VFISHPGGRAPAGSHLVIVMFSVVSEGLEPWAEVARLSSANSDPHSPVVCLFLILAGVRLPGVI